MNKIILTIVIIGSLLANACTIAEKKPEIDDKTSQYHAEIEQKEIEAPAKIDISYEYLKKVNEYINGAMEKIYEVSRNDKIDPAYVLSWDAYKPIIAEQEGTVYKDKGNLDLDHHDVKNLQFTALDVLFPENLHLQQVIFQKVRKKAAGDFVKESLMYTIDMMNMAGVGPTEEEKSQPGYDREEWYLKEALERELSQTAYDSYDIARRVIKPYAEVQALLDLYPDAINNPEFTKFKASAPMRYFEERVLKYLQDYVNGKVTEEEKIYILR